MARERDRGRDEVETWPEDVILAAWPESAIMARWCLAVLGEARMDAWPHMAQANRKER